MDNKEVKVRMKHSSPLQEYHGCKPSVDVIAGEEFSLPMNEAIALVRRMPDDFEPVDFELPKMEKITAESGNTIRLRLRYNPYMDAYHSRYADLEGPGDEADFPEQEAKRLLTEMPKSVFEVVDSPFQDDGSESGNSGEEDAEDLSPVEVENKQIDGQILSLVAEEAKSFDEIKRMLGNLDPNRIRMRVMSLARMNKMEKDDEDRWAIQK